MLLRVHDDLFQVSFTPEMRYGAENIGIAAHEGKHLLAGGLRVLQRLRDLPGLSERARNAYSTAIDQRNDTAQLSSQLSAWVWIVAGVQVQRGDPAWRVGVEWFADSARTQASRLFAEAADDAKLYQHFATAALPHGAKLHFQPRPTGGGNFAAAWGDAGDGAPAIAVVDSDKVHLSAPEGSTATNLRAAEAEIPTPSIRHLEVLTIREAENALSTNLIAGIYTEGLSRKDQDNLHIKRDNAARAIEQCLAGHQHGFADLKKAIAPHLLPDALLYLDRLSPIKRREALLHPSGPPPHLPKLLMSWGIAAQKTRS